MRFSTASNPPGETGTPQRDTGMSTPPPVPVIEIRDSDRDALHILPLGILPLQTLAVRRARLIKNFKLEAVIEFFEGRDTGSGQLGIEDSHKEFGWKVSPPHPDLTMLRKLGQLPSYDVYSLRILLRESDIVVDQASALRLSPTMVRELTSYMSDFTRPLIQEVYGTDDVLVKSFDDLLALFRAPDIRRAKQKLQEMADKLEVKLMDIPRFLEDYADIFLSFSYYRRCLDQTMPAVDNFQTSLKSLRTNYTLKNDHSFQKTCEMILATVNDLLTAITGRFENFELSTADMWRNLTAERFRAVESLIRSYHVMIGTVLCFLSVKFDSWVRMFPNPSVDKPIQRAEFLMTGMRPGFDGMRRIENLAPMLSTLQ
jgi:hypothetical protein